MLIQRALKAAPFTLRDLAAEIGGSYGTLREWARGARTPSDENVSRIASGLEARAEKLRDLAQELRSATQEGQGGGERITGSRPDRP